MAIKLTTTAKAATHVSVLVHGESGVGKTTLAKTCPNPLIISSEKKLISLKDENIPVVLIENHEDLEEVLEYIQTDKKYQKFETIIFDSVSDIAETILAYFKENPVDGNTHPQAAYGMLADKFTPLIKKFRDLGNKHVYIIAKTKRVEDQYTGITQWSPWLPGQQLGIGLPYLFDYVFAMRIGETDKGKKYRYLQTQADLQWTAKGANCLNLIEKPHLGEIFDKILSESKSKSKKEKE